MNSPKRIEETVSPVSAGLTDRAEHGDGVFSCRHCGGLWLPPVAVGLNPAEPALSSNSSHCPECGGPLRRIGFCFTCLLCGWGGCS